MKFCFLILLSSSGFVHGANLNRYVCTNGQALKGPEMSINIGSWVTAGEVRYRNPLPSEYAWTGGEAPLGTNEVLTELGSFGPLSSISGGEFLRGSHKFIALQSKQDPRGVVQVNKIYIEGELLDGRLSSGLVIHTRLAAAESRSEKSAEVMICERLVSKGQLAPAADTDANHL